MYLQHESLLLFSRQYRLNVFGKEKVMARLDDSVLQAALVGYAAELEKINERIAAIQHQLNGRSTRAASPTGGAGTKPKSGISAAGRKHIAAAQRKRWAAYHAKRSGPAKRTAPKRKMSAGWRAALVANLAKARAVRAAKKAAV
jgi:hypothetical protein